MKTTTNNASPNALPIRTGVRAGNWPTRDLEDKQRITQYQVQDLRSTTR